MKNEVKVIENEVVLFETGCVAKAYDFSRSILKDEAKVGTIHLIVKNGELFDETISVKQANGKVVMMLKSKFENMNAKAEGIRQKRAAEAAEAQAKKEAREKANQLKEALQTAKANYKAKKAELLKALEDLTAKHKETIEAIQTALNELNGVDTESVQNESQDAQEGAISATDIFNDKSEAEVI